MDWKRVQARLGVAADGIPGPQTYGALLAHVASRPVNLPVFALLGAGFASHVGAYGIDATVARLANFIGQGCHETEGFRFMREIWGPTPAQKGYEGRADLGNTVSGDGLRYMGRGIFQLTGRANYAHYGQLINVDLEENPALAEAPDTAVLIACEYWHQKKLNDLADNGQEDTITRRINGGTNGIADRRMLVARAKEFLA